MSLSLKKKLTVLLAVILALWLMLMGVTKLMVGDTIIAAFHEWGVPRWLMVPIGTIEIVSAVCLFVPKYRNYAVALIILLMAGALAVHFRAEQYLALFAPLGVITLAVSTVILRLQIARETADRDDDRY